MEKNARIYVAGHRELVGSAIIRKLSQEGYTNLIYLSNLVLDLTQQNEVERFFKEYHPDYVFLSAARSGALKVRSETPATDYFANSMIANNVIRAARAHGASKLLYLASACVYPQQASLPLAEADLMNGPLDPTVEAMALARLTGIKLCEFCREQFGSNFISVIPAAVYGIHDVFESEDSPLLPTLLRQFHEAKQQDLPLLTLEGSPTARSEALYADDLADALLFLMDHYDEAAPLNIGAGRDYSFQEIAEKMQSAVGYHGAFQFSSPKTDPLSAAPNRRLDTGRLNDLGWQAQTSLEDGLAEVYAWFQYHYAEISAGEPV